MDNNIIDTAFNEGQIVKSLLFKAQGEDNSAKIIERFSYKFLEGLRRKDSGDLTYNLIKLYCNLEQRKIPEFFKELLKDIGSMNQIGYAFLLGLNSYKSSEKPSEQNKTEDITESNESNENDEKEE